MNSGIYNLKLAEPLFIRFAKVKAGAKKESG
jgi:hypothetical protein